ncbi:MAG: PA2779 family protein [Bryobacterales bacterium]|nr:PA2779 family protein [Bryobacterales bacterium]
MTFDRPTTTAAAARIPMWCGKVGALRKGYALCAAVAMLAGSAPAAEHIVPRATLQGAVAQAQAASRADRSELLRLLETTPAQKALTSAGVEYRQVEQAVAALDDATAARLADRARQVNRDFAAGALSNETLTYIVIALATAVIVIIAVS